MNRKSNMMRPIGLTAFLLLIAAFSWLFVANPLAEARVTELVITRVESPTFDGVSFGAAGQYEFLVGHARGELDPADPLNAGIVNIDKAPTNSDGHVEYMVDVALLKPVDLSRGNGAILFNVLNRGNKQAIANLNGPVTGANANNPSTANDAGNGFLMRQGYTILWSAWQGDVAPGNNRMLADFPVATNPDGSPIVGLSREEFINNSNASPFVGNLSYPAADLDPSKATLTVRENETDPRQTPAGLAFRYLSDRQIEITRPADPAFDGGAIFEFIYPAKDPIVMGIGFAAMRDVISFMRREAADDAGNPNPLVGPGGPMIDRVLEWGSSQSGRYVRDMLWQGFMEDENGRHVFDGIIPHKPGSRKTFTNFQFSQPGRFSRQHEDHLFPGDQFPFTYATRFDPVSGKTDGLLARCLASDTCPKIMHTDTGSEAWQARGSLVITDEAGRDIPLPDNVRVYWFASTQHGVAATPSFGRCQQLSNPADWRPALRAVLVALDEWVSRGIKPPKSRIPRVKGKGGTLVLPDQASRRFPEIPGVNFGRVNPITELDTSDQPPVPIPGHDYVVKVPKVDRDGNDIAGIRVPAISVPLATHTGWNLRRAGFAEGEGCSLTGSFIPFAETKKERKAVGDPRKSIEERYKNLDKYVKKVEKAVKRLVKDRLMLEEDAERIIAAAPEAGAAVGLEPKGKGKR